MNATETSMTRDMNTIYGQDLWNYGAWKLRNCGEGFGGRKAVATLRKDFCRFLRIAAVLLLMVVGVSEMKAQDETDYSGTYYIASGDTRGSNNMNDIHYDSDNPTSNYYLCPTDEENWICYVDPDNYTNPASDNDQPFLTTYKYRAAGEDATEAQWVFEKVPESEYYYIIHKKTTRYLTYNGIISTTSGRGVNRIRFHLQSTATENSLFRFEQDADVPTAINIVAVAAVDTYYYNDNGQKNCIYLNLSSADDNSLTGTSGKTDGPKGCKNVGATIGIWYDPGRSSEWFLEDVIQRPTISYNADNMIEITAQSGEASPVIKYTIDGTTPSATNGETYSAPFDLADGVTTIKAVEIVNGEVSNVATYEPTFFLGSTHKYIIQSKQCQFYNLIPNTSIDENTKYVSTLNVPCETMAWHFEYAEEGYYYVVDNSGWYLYYTTTDNSNKYLYLKSSKDDSDGYKFSITAHTSGGFNIIPKGQTTPVYKANYGGSSVGLTPARLAGNTSDATSRWDIIPYNAANLPQWADAPFDNVSDDDHTYYYRIVSVNQTAKPIILNNDGAIKSQTIPDGIDERKTMWIIKDAGTSGLLHYYSFENAYTGEKLYYNGNGRNNANNVLQLGLPSVEGANEQWSHFVIVQTEAGNGYNIIPRPIVDNTKAINASSNNDAFNCINRRGGNDILGTYYDDGNGSRWTFSQVNFCMPLEFTESEGNITLTCATNGAEIHYTTDGTTPDGTTPNVVGESTSWASSEQHRIKAIAVVSDGTNTASSTVVTLLNKPDVTLAAGPYTYKDAAWEPTVTKVSIGESGSETVSSIDPTTYTVSYSADRTNVGTVTVTLENKVEGDMYVWNASTTFDITQKPVTITADSDTKVYNGTALTKSTATATGLVEGHSLASVTVTGTQTVVGEINNVPSAAVIKKGETDVTANYNITYTNGTLTVTAKAVTITAKDASRTYNGSALTEDNFTATALEAGDTHTFTVVMTEGSTITNIGSKDNEIATVDGVAVTTGTETTVGNYKVTTAKGTLTINPKAVTITANDASKEYNGSPLTESGFTTTALEQGDTHTFTVTMTAESTITNRGEQPNVIATVDGVAVTTGTEKAIGNYLVTTVNGKLKVTGRVITITAGSDTKVYDGTALTKNSYTYEGTLYSGDEITSVTVTGSQTVAGNSDNVPSGAVIKNGEADRTSNYDFTYVNGTLTVTKRALAITAGSDTKVYDGTALTNNTYTITNNTTLATGDEIKSVTFTGSQTDAGSCDNVPSAAVIKNANSVDVASSYDITYTNGTLTVTRKAVTITAKGASKVYNGTALTEAGFTASALETDDTHTFTVVMTEGSTITNVGTKDNEIATVDGVTVTTGTETTVGNYKVTTAKGTLTVTAKAVTITAKGASKVYNGIALTESGFTATDLESGDTHTFTVVMTEGSTITNIGTKDNVIATVDGVAVTTGSETTVGNYKVTTAKGTLTVTAKAVTITAKSAEKEYDGTPLTESGFTTTALEEGDTHTFAVVMTTGSTITNKVESPKPNVIATVDGVAVTTGTEKAVGNYMVTTVNGTLTITEKVIGVNNIPAEGIDIDITYDGSTYTVTVKQGDNTLEEGDTKDYTWTGTGTDTYVVTVTGRNNYSGSAQATYIKLDFYDTTPDASSTSETWAAVYYNATQNLQVSNEFDAYYVTNLANNTLTLTKVDVSEVSYIPANQPVLLIGEATSKLQGFTVKTYSGSLASDEGSNLLKVVTAEGGLDVELAQVYMFSKGEFVLTKAGTMSKGKFYLDNPNYTTPAPSRSIIRITTENTTGINSSQLSDTESHNSDIWYSIGGQKLNKKPTRKGLYLQNGKKVVIK